MNTSELARVIESVGKDRGIKREIIISALEQAILSAAQKRYGPNAVLEAHYNSETGEIDLFLFKKVVESEPEMLEESEEINLDEARVLDPECNIGDELGVKVEGPGFGRIADGGRLSDRTRPRDKVTRRRGDLRMARTIRTGAVDAQTLAPFASKTRGLARDD